MERALRFARRLPTAILLSGGIINPWLWPNIQAAWKSTGPPPPPIELTDEEWESFMEALRD